MRAATDWKEVIAPDEAAQFEALAQTLQSLQRARAKGGKADRGLHAKGQLAARAIFEVLADLPEAARAGLFAEPKTYETYVRFSNGSGARQHDKKGDVRGIALKLLSVGGKKVIPGMEDETTQDFLLIRSRAVPFRTPLEFVTLVAALSSPTGLLTLPFKLGLFRTLGLLKQLSAGLKDAPVSLAEAHSFSALPIRFGATAARLALKPHASGGPLPSGDADGLGAELSQRLKQGPVTFDFQVQLFESEATTPIEDPTVDWSTPYFTVARLTLPQQDTTTEAARAFAQQVEELSFDPWHAQEALRPVGAMMRARNAAYRLSTLERGAAKEPR